MSSVSLPQNVSEYDSATCDDPRNVEKTVRSNKVPTDGQQGVANNGDTNNTSHNDAGPAETYASRVAPHQSDEEFSDDLLRKTLFRSELEREHFHYLNIMPDRPCTAFFNIVDNTITAKEIFEEISKDAISATSVRCLQRNPNGSVLITFTKA